MQSEGIAWQKGKQHRASAAKPKPGGKKSARKLGKPDTSVLANYDPTDSTGSHPEWVKKKFPAYIASHAGHEMTSVREFSHSGHTVRISTTYRVEVDGHPVHVPLSVDEDGRVHTHATPFVTYGSANDLMKAVLDAYPNAFADHGGQHDHRGNGGTPS